MHFPDTSLRISRTEPVVRRGSVDTEPGSWLKARLCAAAHTAEAGSPQVAHFWLLSRALLLLSLSLLPSFSEAPLLGSGEYVLPFPLLHPPLGSCHLDFGECTPFPLLLLPRAVATTYSWTTLGFFFETLICPQALKTTRALSLKYLAT